MLFFSLKIFLLILLQSQALLPQMCFLFEGADTTPHFPIAPFPLFFTTRLSRDIISLSISGNLNAPFFFNIEPHNRQLILPFPPRISNFFMSPSMA